eukprot:8538988-Lingulodinium_polyedra.AAC.1
MSKSGPTDCPFLQHCSVKLCVLSARVRLASISACVARANIPLTIPRGRVRVQCAISTRQHRASARAAPQHRPSSVCTTTQ